MELSKERKKIAIVTGASAGLGKEFALQLEKKYFLDEIWLLARRADPMKQLAEKLQKANAVIIPCDLNSDSDIRALIDKIKRENPSVSFLVNNAGFGKLGPFTELTEQEQMQMISLNVTALTRLTYSILPFCAPGSCIIQVASSIAFCPAPFFAVYAATKSFVLSLSRALQFELKPKGIHVIAVCPGPVNTEFFDVANNNGFMKSDRVAPKTFNHALMADPKKVVTKALNDAEKKRSISIYSFSINFFARIVAFIPKSLAMKVISNRY